MDPVGQATTSWWEKQRLRFNLTVVGIGFACFILYAIGISRSHDPEAEITLITLALQGFAAGVYLMGANLGYLLGELVERWIRPEHVAAYRRLAYRGGTALTVLPFVGVAVHSLFLLP